MRMVLLNALPADHSNTNAEYCANADFVFDTIIMYFHFKILTK